MYLSKMKYEKKKKKQQNYTVDKGILIGMFLIGIEMLADCFNLKASHNGYQDRVWKPTYMFTSVSIKVRLGGAVA